MPLQCLAVDIGASSGRIILGSFENNKLTFIQKGSINDEPFEVSYSGELKEGKIEGNFTGEWGENPAAATRVIKVNKLAVETGDIYGGVQLDISSGTPKCTGGFSVIDADSTKGITTAGHCENQLYYNGVWLPFKGGTTGGDFDIQWNRGDQAFNVQSWIYDGSDTRGIIN